MLEMYAPGLVLGIWGTKGAGVPVRRGLPVLITVFQSISDLAVCPRHLIFLEDCRTCLERRHDG